MLTQEEPMFTISNKINNWLAHAIFLLIVGIVFVTSGSSLANADAVFRTELAFITLCLFTPLPFSKIIYEHKRTAIVMALWFLCITFSLIHSPLNLLEKPFVLERYVQTLTHVLTFLFFWNFIYRSGAKIERFLFAAPLSTLLIVGAFFYEWLDFSSHLSLGSLSLKWWHEPPFNSHLRHTGYQATAGLSVLIALFIFKKASRYEAALQFIALTMLWSFVLWLGGRAAIMSAIGVMLYIWMIVRIKSINKNLSFCALGASPILGLFVSELLPNLDWSGAIRIYHSVSTADNINDLSTGRIKIWLSTWESLKDHPIFGLGPQGYYYMPNRIFGYQPHNVFLQFLTEWGLIGSVLFLYLLVTGFWQGVKLHIVNRDTNLNQSALAAGAIIVALTIHSLVDGTYYHPQPSFYLAMAYAFWLCPDRPKNKHDNLQK
ncbi:O-antigen ligase family protein [Methylomicrobium lacus]|uniref:O-antigen ligase family protein n=1 Tax=Methylomicrobium lacus TaxID=136992 RepID=UPI0035A8F601